MSNRDSADEEAWHMHGGIDVTSQMIFMVTEGVKSIYTHINIVIHM